MDERERSRSLLELYLERSHGAFGGFLDRETLKILIPRRVPRRPRKSQKNNPWKKQPRPGTQPAAAAANHGTQLRSVPPVHRHPPPPPRSRCQSISSRSAARSLHLKLPGASSTPHRNAVFLANHSTFKRRHRNSTLHQHQPIQLQHQPHSKEKASIFDSFHRLCFAPSC